ncbi:ParE-like toxin of type II ParDE toxin-antitoxin system [Mucilaginibacter gracilis]|uniref:ParE-like toxin of type II ParDE toxin-antitoxin system n=1 Tax=Mucilaginibacter gracilis TaxID=423350 RepID=A0A495J8S3_9SPHI|nr:type II toxin-antitoxin system RelE/ParE family toxin [Mucilaginibacter gracilis]RKR85395.1 ParE-like toxin of type II ParDE toxin-antitoxin system [Mucilaginibacter gracilis]
MYQLIFHSETQKDLQESYDWYEEQGENLGEQLLYQIEEGLEKVKNNPFHYQIITKKLRQALIEVFPFVICYEIDEKRELIYVSAIFHTSRNPKQKLRRKFNK